MVAFAGIYQLATSDNFEEYLAALGVSIVMRKLAATAKPITEIIQDVNGQDWTIRTSTSAQVSEIKFRLGEDFADETAHGLKCRSVITMDANTLVQKQKVGAEQYYSVREFGDNQMILKMTHGEVTAIRTYSKLDPATIRVPTALGESVAQGCKSFLKNVGGAAGALSEFGGYIGKGAAVATLDSEFQHSRREILSRRPQNATESLTRSWSLLSKGVIDGVTGPIVLPIVGIRTSGAEGLFCGVAKGVIGVVTKPALGFVDFASGLLDTAKVATSISEEVVG